MFLSKLKFFSLHLPHISDGNSKEREIPHFLQTFPYTKGISGKHSLQKMLLLSQTSPQQAHLCGKKNCLSFLSIFTLSLHILRLFYFFVKFYEFIFSTLNLSFHTFRPKPLRRIFPCRLQKQMHFLYMTNDFH